MFNFKVAALSGFLVNNFDFFVSFLIKLYNWGIWEEGKSKKSFFGPTMFNMKSVSEGSTAIGF